MAAQKIEGRIREARGGELYLSNFGKRFQGEGTYWNQIQSTFGVHLKKLGLNEDLPKLSRPPFKRPTAQMELAL